VCLQVAADRAASKHLGQSPTSGKQARGPIPPDDHTVNDPAVPAFGEYEDTRQASVGHLHRWDRGTPQLLDHSEIEQIRALLGSLNDRERMILRARYGLDGAEQSLPDVGERIGLSGERVRHIEQRAVGKLRAAANRGEHD